MANWTTSDYTLLTTPGVTMPTQTVNLTISPSNGYVLTAGEFQVSGGVETPVSSGIWVDSVALPSIFWNADPEVKKVIFSDNGVPGTSTNTVNASIELYAWVVPSGTQDYINIDIDVIEATDPPTETTRQVCITSLTSGTNHTIVNLEGTGISSPAPSISSGVTAHFHSGYVTGGTTSLIFTKTFSADSGYYYLVPGPQGNITGSPYPTGMYTQIPTYTYNAAGQITGSVIEVWYTPPVPNNDISNTCELDHKITFYQDVREIIVLEPVLNRITDLVINSVDMNMTGETRSLKVYGDVGETYNLTITAQTSGDTYDFATSLFSSAATLDTNRTIPLTPSMGSNYGYYEYQIVFPSTSVGQTFDILISAGNTSPTLVSTLPTATLPSTPNLRIYQTIKPIISYNARSLDNSSLYTLGSTTTITAKPGYVSRPNTSDGVSTLSIVATAKTDEVDIAIARQPINSDFTTGVQLTLGAEDGITTSENLTLAGDYVNTGMIVSGTSIVPGENERYVTVVEVGATVIILSSLQTIPGSEVLTFSSNSDVTITDILASVDTSGEVDVLTITATATVNTFGTEDLKIELELDNFITLT